MKYKYQFLGSPSTDVRHYSYSNEGGLLVCAAGREKKMFQTSALSAS